MNYLKEGHITRCCQEQLMCPYCAGTHAVAKCDMHSKMTTNCTACERHLQKRDLLVDIKALFLEKPRYLRHSPLYPNCPAIIAGQQAMAARSGKKQKNLTPLSPQKKTGNASLVDPVAIHDGEPATTTTRVEAPGAEAQTNMSLSY